MTVRSGECEKMVDLKKYSSRERSVSANQTVRTDRSVHLPNATQKRPNKDVSGWLLTVPWITAGVKMSGRF